MDYKAITIAVFKKGTGGILNYIPVHIYGYISDLVEYKLIERVKS